MKTASADSIGGTGKSTDGPSSVARSVAVNGNRIDEIIVHGEDTYRPRLASQNKLILTK